MRRRRFARRERLGLERDPDWERIKNELAAPKPRDGVYPAIETAPYTPLIDPEAMRRTLDSLKADWEWPSTWGWDYPRLAMCAARLGDASKYVAKSSAAPVVLVASAPLSHRGSLEPVP